MWKVDSAIESESSSQSEERAFHHKERRGRKGKSRLTTDDTDFGKASRGDGSLNAQIQKFFTTEDAEEGQGLPLMNADDTDRKSLPRMEAHDRGLESGIKPVEWKPTPDMYRTDTPEAREAYEASFRMTIAPRLGAERKPVQPVIAPGEPSQTHAILG